MNNDLRKAIKIVKQGGIIIFPTDTVFGVGCRVDNERAIEKVFKIKRKPKARVAPILVSGIDMAEQYLEPIPEEVRQLMKKFWPDGLTIVFPCVKGKVSARIQGEGNTLGVRMPGHGTIIKLIKGVGVPIIASSANFHGDRDPSKFAEIDKKFIALTDFVLRGRCKTGIRSTIIDCSRKPWKVLREGAISKDKILNIKNKI